MISNYIIGLQNGFEHKTKYLLEYYDNHMYDLVVKYNNDIQRSYFQKYNLLYFTKYIPVCIFYNIPFVIGDKSVIDIEEFIKEVEQYILQQIDIESLLNLSKTTVIKYNEKYYNIDELDNSKLCVIFKYFVPKIVDLNDFVKENSIIVFEGSRGFYDTDSKPFNYHTINQSSSNIFSLTNPRFINDIIGITDIFESYCNFSLHNNKELFNVNYLYEKSICNENIKNTISKNYNWLNLDKLLKTIRNIGANIIVIFGSKLLKNFLSLNIFYDESIHNFINIRDYKLFIEKEIYNLPNISDVLYIE